MKRKFLHMLLGVATLIGSYSAVMAAETGTINEEAKVYSTPDTESDYIYRVYEGETFEVIDEVDGFYEINVDGENVYVESDYVDLEKDEIPETVNIEDNEKVTQVISEDVKSSNGQKVVDFAKKFIGTPYVTGGSNLYSGVDCSGFTQQVYKNFGVNLERTSRSQYACNGYSVSKSDLKAGDLVFYGYDSVCHVAIYTGNNQVIHAPVPGKSVCVVPLYQRGDAPIIGCKRIFND